jgi:hypothetical protein
MQMRYMLTLLALLLMTTTSCHRQPVRSDGKWLIEFINTGDEWKNNPPDEVRMSIGKGVSVLERQQIGQLQRDISLRRMSDEDPQIKKFLRQRTDTGKIVFVFSGRALTCRLAEVKEVPNIRAIILPREPISTGSILYFRIEESKSLW